MTLLFEHQIYADLRDQQLDRIYIFACVLNNHAL